MWKTNIFIFSFQTDKYGIHILGISFNLQNIQETLLPLQTFIVNASENIAGEPLLKFGMVFWAREIFYPTKTEYTGALF